MYLTHEEMVAEAQINICVHGECVHFTHDRDSSAGVYVMCVYLDHDRDGSAGVYVMCVSYP